MNPVFWVLVLLICTALWFFLRRIFVWIGTRADNMMRDTRKILDSDKNSKEENKNEGNHD